MSLLEKTTEVFSQMSAGDMVVLAMVVFSVALLITIGILNYRYRAPRHAVMMIRSKYYITDDLGVTYYLSLTKKCCCRVLNVAVPKEMYDHVNQYGYIVVKCRLLPISKVCLSASMEDYE